MTKDRSTSNPSAQGNFAKGFPLPSAIERQQFLDLLGHFRRLLDDVDGGFLQLLAAQGRDFYEKFFASASNSGSFEAFS